MFNQFNENIRQIYLATCLYDCIEDNNTKWGYDNKNKTLKYQLLYFFRAIETLLEDNDANPNVVLPDKGVSPFHLIVGNSKDKFAEDITKLFLKYGGNPNIR